MTRTVRTLNQLLDQKKKIVIKDIIGTTGEI